MPNTAIPRDTVHQHSEECSDMTMGFQTIATRLLRSQNRLKNFMEQNFTDVDPMAGQVALYMLSVSMRVFEQVGGRMKKINSGDIKSAQKKVHSAVDSLLPLDSDFPTRAKGVEWRAQPNLLDEILWALYERDDDEKKEEEEAVLDDKQSAMIYIMLWTAIEALDAKWVPPNE